MTSFKRSGWLASLLVFSLLLIVGCNSQPAQVQNANSAATTSPTTSASPMPSASGADLIAQADKLYAQREDLARLREGIILLKRARAEDFNNYDAAWRLSQFNYHLGSHTKDEAESEKAFQEGIEAGQAAIKLQDGKPEGHFWLGANYGGRAQKSSLSGLASTEDIRKEMQRVIELDERYMAGSAYMALGQVELELPRLMGGDPKKAVEYLEKGLKFGETNSLLRLNLAKAYIAVGRKADARAQINALFNMKPDPNYLPEHKEAVEEAKKLLEKIA